LREPTDGDVTPGGLIVFHCRASGGSQSPVVHWRKNGEVIDLQQQQRYRQLRSLSSVFPFKKKSQLMLLQENLLNGLHLQHFPG
jgi:hypothetical protein